MRELNHRKRNGPRLCGWRMVGMAALGMLAAPAFAQTPAAQDPSGTASQNSAGTASQDSAGAASHDHDHATAASHDMAADESGFKRSPAPTDAYVYIGWPNDGEIVKTTHVKVWFGARNFGVAPAGTYKANTGHHHLLIDTPLPPLDQPIPNDKNHLHFGLGQTETIVDLTPGTHTLQILMGDGDHVPHDPPLMSKKITIHVLAAPG